MLSTLTSGGRSTRKGHFLTEVRSEDVGVFNSSVVFLFRLAGAEFVVCV